MLEDWPLQWFSNSILPIIAKLECISSQRKSDIYIHSRERGIKNWITIWYDFWKQIISICLTLIWSCFVCEINFTFKWIKIIIILMNELWTIYYSYYKIRNVYITVQLINLFSMRIFMNIASIIMYNILAMITLAHAVENSRDCGIKGVRRSIII